MPTDNVDPAVPATPMLHVLGLILDKFDVKEVRLNTKEYIEATGRTEVFYDPETKDWVIRRVDDHNRLVHREPDCQGSNQCQYPEPHKHGFDCDKSCTECQGYCHPVCPANENGETQ